MQQHRGQTLNKQYLQHQVRMHCPDQDLAASLLRSSLLRLREA